MVVASPRTMGENGMVMTVPIATAVLGAAVVYSALAQPPPAAPALAGTSWRLVKFQGGDGTTLTPDDRSKYTIQFGPDGFLTARIDCNRGRGSWTLPAPNQLRLGPLALTRAMCPPGSLHDRIVKHWDYIRSYVVKDGYLFLSLMADGGIYEFEPVAAGKTPVAGQTGRTVVKGTATFRERMVLPPNAVFEAQLEDVSRMDAPAEVIARTALKSLGNPPFAFEIPYDPARIQSNHSYSVRGRIRNRKSALHDRYQLPRAHARKDRHRIAAAAPCGLFPFQAASGLVRPSPREDFGKRRSSARQPWRPRILKQSRTWCWGRMGASPAQTDATVSRGATS